MAPGLDYSEQLPAAALVSSGLDPVRDYLLELAGLYEKASQNREAIEIYKQFPENAAAQSRMGELLLELTRPLVERFEMGEPPKGTGLPTPRSAHSATVLMRPAPR